ncbi:DUF1294 domain-containing protein [Candidatus Leptofilum sp.]|uniref:DUF1294 domain-containing protein n=1 Tax=Candidatus Leptofilum sp. TaxID=3241576 RepID=UPI003B59F55F
MSLQEAGVIWILFINIVALVTYRFDKIRAGSGRSRVPERNLLLLALVGGSPAAFIAMFLMKPRHKSRKLSFQLKFWGIVVGHAALLWFYWQFWQRP